MAKLQPLELENEFNVEVTQTAAPLVACVADFKSESARTNVHVNWLFNARNKNKIALYDYFPFTLITGTI